MIVWTIKGTIYFIDSLSGIYINQQQHYDNLDLGGDKIIEKSNKYEPFNPYDYPNPSGPRFGGFDGNVEIQNLWATPTLSPDFKNDIIYDKNRIKVMVKDVMHDKTKKFNNDGEKSDNDQVCRYDTESYAFIIMWSLLNYFVILIFSILLMTWYDINQRSI